MRYFSFLVIVLSIMACTGQAGIDEATGVSSAKLTVVPLNKLNGKPQRADRISIDAATFNNILNNIMKNATEDSSLNVNESGLLITTSFSNKSEYWIYPPTTGPLFSSLKVSAYNRNDTLAFRFECPAAYQKLCECMEAPPPPGCMGGDDRYKIDPDIILPINYNCIYRYSISTQNVDCTLRRSCETKNNLCISKYKYVQKSRFYDGSFGTVLFLTCKCLCP